MPSENIENYLKNIYALQSLGGKVTTSALSEKMQISAPSVSEMLKKLAQEQCVLYTPYKGVKLTPEGHRRALRIIRRHRLWELFLVRVLNYEWDEIHEEAERLEHSTSEKLEGRLDAALGYPRLDPHGHVIPTAEGEMRDLSHPALADTEPGQSLRVCRVSDTDPEVLQYASRLGITLRKRLRVLEKVSFDGSLRVQINGREQFISATLARHIFVEVLRIPRE